MFVHTVFFWLRHPESNTDRASLAHGLHTLRAIDAIGQAHIGTPAPTRRPVIDHSYDFSLTLIFADQVAHDAYQVHPAHERFVADYAHLWERVQIYDAVGDAVRG
jgi:Stress responsive A/B Barrel Domain